MSTRLVADLLEVLAQLDDRVEGVGRLDRVRVVGDEERLCGLVDDDTFLALRVVSLLFSTFLSVGYIAHLLCLQRVVSGLDGHVLVAVDLDAVCNDSLGLALVVEGCGDGAHLSSSELEPVSIPIYICHHIRSSRTKGANGM